MLLSTAEWVLISTVIYYLVSFPASPGFSLWFVLTIIHGGYLMPTWAGKIACQRFNWMLQSSLEMWWLEHSVEMSASYFLSWSW